MDYISPAGGVGATGDISEAGRHIHRATYPRVDYISPIGGHGAGSMGVDAVDNAYIHGEVRNRAIGVYSVLYPTARPLQWGYILGHGIQHPHAYTVYRVQSRVHHVTTVCGGSVHVYNTGVP